MAQVEKVAGTVAWTGSWRLPSNKRDHQQAVRASRRRDRRALTDLRRGRDCDDR